MSAVARRYAQAAVEAADEQGGTQAVDEMAAGLRAFRSAYRESRDLVELVCNPALAERRANVLREIGKTTGIHPLAQSLILVLTENERMDELNDVTEAVLSIADEKLSRTRAHVISAVPLSEDQEQRLATALQKRLGHAVVLDIEIDPAILGGLVCRVGSYTIDSSVKRQLEIMAERLHHD